MLTAEQILAADDLPRIKVDVPEWGGEVYVRRMTGADLDEYEEALRKNSDDKDNLVSIKGLRLVVVSLCCCDDAGKRLFTTPEQIEALSRKSGEPIKRIFSAASDHNGLSKKAAEELEKN